MRNGWFGAFLLALALTVQAWAAAGNVAMARATPTTRPSVAFCPQAAGNSNGGHYRHLPSHDDQGGGSCTLCQICCNGTPPVEATSLHVGMATPIQWTTLAWSVTVDGLWTPRRERSRQARAPPILS